MDGDHYNSIHHKTLPATCVHLRKGLLHSARAVLKFDHINDYHCYSTYCSPVNVANIWVPPLSLSWTQKRTRPECFPVTAHPARFIHIPINTTLWPIHPRSRPSSICPPRAMVNKFDELAQQAIFRQLVPPPPSRRRSDKSTLAAPTPRRRVRRRRQINGRPRTVVCRCAANETEWFTGMAPPWTSPPVDIGSRGPPITIRTIRPLPRTTTATKLERSHSTSKEILIFSSTVVVWLIQIGERANGGQVTQLLLIVQSAAANDIISCCTGCCKPPPTNDDKQLLAMFAIVNIISSALSIVFYCRHLRRCGRPLWTIKGIISHTRDDTRFAAHLQIELAYLYQFWARIIISTAFHIDHLQALMAAVGLLKTPRFFSSL